MGAWLLLALSLAAHAAPPPAEAAPLAAEAPPAGLLAERVRGEWVISLSAEEKRAVELMAFAFADPMPTDEAIAAKGLTADEKMTVEVLIGMRRASPGGAELAEMQRVLRELPTTSLTITADVMTFGLAGQQAAGRYEVVDDSGGALKIRHHPPDSAPKEATLSIEGDLLVMTDAGRAVRFRRR